MRTYALGALLLLGWSSGSLLADDLTWGGTYVANWDNFGTSPYSATNTTNGQQLQIFCLDFNDEIAPPFDWSASIIPLTQANVAGTGAYQNQYAAQYGGAYNQLLSNAFNSTPAIDRASSTVAQVSGTPFSFSGDSKYSLNMSSSINDPYTRYVEAAWLFTEIQGAVAQNPEDKASDMIAQAAAWELFVNGSTDCTTNPTSNYCALTKDVRTYSGAYTFNDYMDNTSLSGVSFEHAVDFALSAAQTAVNGGWSPDGWNIVTATPTWVVTNTANGGKPVQEFLSFGATPDAPPFGDGPGPAPVPEPGAVFLLATAAGITLWRFHKRDSA